MDISGIGSVLGVGGNLVAGTAASLGGNLLQYEENRRLQENAQDFSASMANTQMQRRVADLKAAGLNPMLAVSSGGAAAPSGTGASVSAPDVVGSMTSGAAVSRIMKELDFLSAQTAKVEADTEVSRAEADRVRSQTAVNAATVPKLWQDVATGRSSAAQLDEMVKNLAAQRAKLAEEIDNLKRQGPNIEAQTDLTRKQSALTAVNTVIGKINANLDWLKQPKAENEANAQKSWWMQNISPFLNDIVKSVGSAVALGAAVKPRGDVNIYRR